MIDLKEIHDFLYNESLKDLNLSYGFIQGKESSNDVVWFEYEFPGIGKSGIQHTIGDHMSIKLLQDNIEFLKSEDKKQSIITNKKKLNISNNG